MYLGSWKINDYLMIPASTHRFSSGAAYVATTISYRIYEDDTNVEIVADTGMANFDGETGLYTGRSQLLAATGFEKGKCYTVLLKGTVDSVAAIHYHTFQIEAEVDSNTISDKTGFSLAADQTNVSIGTVTYVADKTGYSISGAKTTLDTLNDITAASVAALVLVTPAQKLVTDVSGYIYLSPIQTNVSLGTVTTVSGNVQGSVASVIGNIGGSVASVIDKLGFSLAANQSGVTLGTVTNIGDKTGFRLSTTGVDDILDEVVETLTLREIMRVALSALAGLSAGGGTTTITFKDYGNIKNRITATVDNDGNRTVITLDGTP